jgi:hypothetical protein
MQSRLDVLDASAVHTDLLVPGLSERVGVRLQSRGAGPELAIVPEQRTVHRRERPRGVNRATMRSHSALASPVRTPGASGVPCGGFGASLPYVWTAGRSPGRPAAAATSGSALRTGLLRLPSCLPHFMPKAEAVIQPNQTRDIHAYVRVTARLDGHPDCSHFGMARPQRSVPDAIRSVLDDADAVCIEAEQTIRAVYLQMRHRVPWPDRRHPHHWSEHDIGKRDEVASNRTDETTR